MRKHVLILANGFVDDAPRALPTELLTFADPACEMHVLAPVQLTRLQSLCSDLDQPRADAHERLDRILQDMTALGLSATGEIADEDQLLAIEDALAQSNAHAIVVVTHAPDQQNWRERQLIANVARFQLPVKDVLITRDGTVARPLHAERQTTPNGPTRCASRHEHGHR
jgi:hypothetical protein